ncbi:hypothetical protein [Streptomyces californicus]|uniref:hypothetical protein n=1 Tax=Streptomyces californicus TaxID=67351 RepID=UPI00379E07FA
MAGSAPHGGFRNGHARHGHDYFPTTEEIGELCGSALTEWVEAAVTAVAASVGKPVERVRSRLVKTVDIKPNRDPDAEDLRECLRVLRVWINDPAAYVPPARRPKATRPEGIGHLPVPRTVKAAHLGISCGLCGDQVKAGELIGRAKDPKGRGFVAMGWMCGHCLYQRSQEPRRRDVLLRFHHHLLAGSAVGLNAYECGVLLTWLTEDPAPAATPAWAADPLEATIARLDTSVRESKGTTWIAAPHRAHHRRRADELPHRFTGGVRTPERDHAAHRGVGGQPGRCRPPEVRHRHPLPGPGSQDDSPPDATLGTRRSVRLHQAPAGAADPDTNPEPEAVAVAVVEAEAVEDGV